MPKKRVRLPYHRTFTPEELRALALGMLPVVMEDKWMGMLQEGSLDFHRSWTGFHIYRLCLRQGEQGIEAHTLLVNRSAKQYFNTDNAFDAEFVGFLTDRWLRGVRA